MALEEKKKEADRHHVGREGLHPERHGAAALREKEGLVSRAGRGGWKKKKKEGAASDQLEQASKQASQAAQGRQRQARSNRSRRTRLTKAAKAPKQQSSKAPKHQSSKAQLRVSLSRCAQQAKPWLTLHNSFRTFFSRTLLLPPITNLPQPSFFFSNKAGFKDVT